MGRLNSRSPNRRAVLATSLLVAGTLALATAPGHAQNAPPGFTVSNAFPTATFSLPTAIVFMPDGRKLVVEKEGRIWVMTLGGNKLATPFIDISAKVLSNGDRGLHGVVLDPDFASNRWVYLLYTVDPDSNGVDDNIGAYARVERYQTNALDPNVLDLSTRQVLLGKDWASGIPQPPRDEHHMVGTLRFAKDRTLLVGSGDAANAGNTDAGGTDPLSSYGAGKTDPAEDLGSFRSQTLNSLCGKILRLNKETGGGLPSNPYWDGNPTSDRSRVWIYGVRNPFRFSIRPGTGSTDSSLAQPGVLYLGDVGWNKTEELDIVRTGGLNMGWPCFEGGYAQPSYQAVTSTYFPNPNVICSAARTSENPLAPTAPALWWDHANGAQSNPVGLVGNCSIGGQFYTGLSYPAQYQGKYFHCDYGAQWIKVVSVDANDNVLGVTPFMDQVGGIVDLEVDPFTGDFYYVDINTSSVMHISYASGNQPPTAHATASPTSGHTPLTVSFAASASTDPENDPLGFLWAFGDGQTSTLADVQHTYNAQGTYSATVTVSDGHGNFNIAAFTIVAGQVAPPGTIQTPLDGAFFNQGQAVPLVAVAADSVQGPATYRWDIDLRHNNHIHLATQTYFGRTTSFVPNTPNDGEQYSFRVRLSVTQGALTAVDTVRVYPRVNVGVTSLTFLPATPTLGQSIQARARVRSTGEVGSSGTFWELRDGTALVAAGPLDPIPNGDSLDVVASFGPLTAGRHTLTFTADPRDSLIETSRFDNAISAPIDVGGLVAAYGFDEGAGSTVTDASGHGLNGTVVSATWTAAGKFGNALSFNGTTAYVDLGSAPEMQLSGSMTVSAWIKATGNPPDDGQIVANSDNSSGWQLKTTPDTGVQTFGFQLSGGINSQSGVYSSTVRALNTWYHVAGVYDAAAQTMTTYVNGVPNNGIAFGVVPPSQVTPGTSVSIGRREGGYYFKGLIDEVRIYNRALTQGEVQFDMNYSVANPPALAVPRSLPSTLLLGPGVPNPFSSATALRYTLPRAGHVKLEVFDVTGKRVRSLIDEDQHAGDHFTTFDSRNLPSGVYLCRLQSGGAASTRKVLLLR